MTRRWGYASGGVALASLMTCATRDAYLVPILTGNPGSWVRDRFWTPTIGAVAAFGLALAAVLAIVAIVRVMHERPRG
ncbi:MAG: hypothetical protein IT378_11150 [Sandaracinaceae bacterium]|nr:hypothetical protein [Sandaracinaceae bacterium]